VGPLGLAVPVVPLGPEVLLDPEGRSDQGVLVGLAVPVVPLGPEVLLDPEGRSDQGVLVGLAALGGLLVQEAREVLVESCRRPHFLVGRL